VRYSAKHFGNNLNLLSENPGLPTPAGDGSAGLSRNLKNQLRLENPRLERGKGGRICCNLAKNYYSVAINATFGNAFEARFRLEFIVRRAGDS
jgi:hypothetical protein